MKTRIIIILLAITFLNCNEDKSEITELKVMNVVLIDEGHVSHEFTFNTESIGDTLRCYTFAIIHSGDTIKSINASVNNQKVIIDVITSPNDFDCLESSCFTLGKIVFDIVGLKEGVYKTSLFVNNGEIGVFDIYY